MIQVDVRKSTHPTADPYEVYEYLRGKRGAASCFLLESLAGPDADRKSAMVGVDPLLELVIRESVATLTGRAPIVELLTRELRQAGWQMTADAVFELGSPREIWNFLRSIHRCFEIRGGGKGSSFAFGFFGYFGYETIRAVENLPRLIAQRADIPDILLKIFSTTIQFDLEKHVTHVVSTSSKIWDAENERLVLDALEARAPAAPVPDVPAPMTVTRTTDRESYLEKIQKCLHYISIGDIYQVQLGYEVLIRSEAPPLDVYRRLRARNPGPYMYLAQLGDVMVIGSSPEVFVRVNGNRLTMRPIAGTAPRRNDEEENKRIVATLLADEKELAEHVMLIDLCRNDMARVCRPSTVDTNELIVVETYSHVFHLVSNVDGELKEGVDCYDVIAACFPAGTMTGAPKVRAMEIIEEQEDTARGLYAGTLGVIDFEGFVSTALCIRSATHRDGTYRLRASAGIVSHSIPEKEWRETLAKLGALYWAAAGSELLP